MKPERELGECERCGQYAEGRTKWMFRNFPPVAREFYCDKCLRVLRVYSIIGMSLLMVILGAAVAAYVWVRML